NFDESSTLATWAKAAGYRTGLFGKYLNGYPFKCGNYTPPGWDQWASFTYPPNYYDYTLILDGNRTEPHGETPADYSTDVLANEVVVFTSDNGLALSEHRWADNKRCEYDECLQVPLLIRGPGLPPHTETRIVSNPDLTATMVDAMDATPTHALDGETLLP